MSKNDKKMSLSYLVKCLFSRYNEVKVDRKRRYINDEKNQKRNLSYNDNAIQKW